MTDIKKIIEAYRSMKEDNSTDGVRVTIKGESWIEYHDYAAWEAAVLKLEPDKTDFEPRQDNPLLDNVRKAFKNNVLIGIYYVEANVGHIKA